MPKIVSKTKPTKDKKAPQPKIGPYDTGAIDGKALHTHNRDKLPKGMKLPASRYKKAKTNPYGTGSK